MEEILLLTVEHVAQAGEDLLVSPPLPPGQYDYDRNATQKVKVVTPDRQVLEKDAEISISLGTRADSYILLFPNTKAVEIPVGSQVWIKRVKDDPSLP